MSIKIEIDVKGCSKQELLHTARFLFNMGGEELVAAPEKDTPVPTERDAVFSDWLAALLKSQSNELNSADKQEVMNEIKKHITRDREPVTDTKQPLVSTPSAPEQPLVSAPSIPQPPKVSAPAAPPVAPKAPETTPNHKTDYNPFAGQPPRDLPDHVKADPRLGESDVELDTRGIPWDSRIHASSKLQIQDGTWKKKRGVAEDFYNKVVAELLQKVEVPTAPPERNPIPEPKKANFAEFLQFATQAITKQQITDKEIVAIVQKYEIESLPLVGQHSEKIPSIIEEIQIAIDHRKNAA